MNIFQKIYAFFADTIQTMLLAGAIFLIIYLFLFRPFQVSGESMFPTFQNKEYILTNLIGLRFENPKRGDVIVFKAPTDNQKDFIKRVIGLPGESVELKEGSVYVNGEKLDESVYLSNDVKTFGGSFLKENEPYKLNPDEYIVMGDNRTFSSDSREWGVLKRSEIIGKAIFVYFPVKRIRVIHNPF